MRTYYTYIHAQTQTTKCTTMQTLCHSRTAYKPCMLTCLQYNMFRNICMTDGLRLSVCLSICTYACVHVCTQVELYTVYPLAWRQAGRQNYKHARECRSVYTHGESALCALQPAEVAHREKWRLLKSIWPPTSPFLVRISLQRSACLSNG